MSSPTPQPLIFGGREFSAADLELIRQITSDFSGLGITEIARTACELLEWKRPNGGLKNLECRRLIEHLAGQGLLRMPEQRGRGAPGPRRVARTAGGESPAEIHGSAGECEPLRVEVVRGGPADRSGDHALFKELLDRHHYLGYRVPFGASLEDGRARCLDRLERRRADAQSPTHRQPQPLSDSTLGAGERAGQQDSGAVRAPVAGGLGEAIRLSAAVAGDTGGRGTFPRRRCGESRRKRRAGREREPQPVRKLFGEAAHHRPAEAGESKPTRESAPAGARCSGFCIAWRPCSGA